jgi:hypothetical protein
MMKILLMIAWSVAGTGEGWSCEMYTDAGYQDQVTKANILRLPEKPACGEPSYFALSDA